MEKKMKTTVLMILVSGLIFMSAAITHADISNGLVAHWKMDEKDWSGTTGEVRDSSGNGYHGIAHGGVTTVTGKFGNAASLDGIDDYIEIPNSSKLHFTSGGFSLVAWVNFTETKNSAVVLGKHRCGRPSGYIIGAESWSNPNGIMFGIERDVRLYTYNTDRYPYNDGKWHCVAAVYDGRKAYFYVDGVSKGILLCP